MNIALLSIYIFVGAALAAKSVAKAAPTINPFYPDYLVIVPKSLPSRLAAFSNLLHQFHQLSIAIHHLVLNLFSAYFFIDLLKKLTGARDLTIFDSP